MKDIKRGKDKNKSNERKTRKRQGKTKTDEKIREKEEVYPN